MPVLLARQDDRIGRAGKVRARAIQEVVADALDRIDGRGLQSQRDGDAEQLLEPRRLLRRIEGRDVDEGRRIRLRRGGLQAIRQGVEADVVGVVELVEHQRGDRLHRLDARPVIGVPVGVIGHFLVEVARDRLRLAGRVDPGGRVVRRRPLADVEIDALERRIGIVATGGAVTRRAELVEARIDVRRVIAGLAGPAHIGAVTQPLVAGRCDRRSAPLNRRIPVVARNADEVRRRHAGVVTAAAGDRRGVVVARGSVVVRIVVRAGGNSGNAAHRRIRLVVAPAHDAVVLRVLAQVRRRHATDPAGAAGRRAGRQRAGQGWAEEIEANTVIENTLRARDRAGAEPSDILGNQSRELSTSGSSGRCTYRLTLVHVLSARQDKPAGLLHAPGVG